jgi:hypothetical protein
MKRIEPINGTFGVVEVKPGQYVIARKLHRCLNTGTVVFEGQDREGKLTKGTKSQITKSCNPYSKRSAAESKLIATSIPDPAIAEAEAKAKRSEAAKKAAATRKANAEAAKAAE